MLLRTFYLQNAETKDVETIVKTALGTQARGGLQPDPGRHHRASAPPDELALAERVIDLQRQGARAR